MAKARGADFKAFYCDKDVWANEAWHEGETITVDGVEFDLEEMGIKAIPDAASVRVDGGLYYRAGIDDEPLDFSKVFRDWMKKRLVVTLAVQLPAGQPELIQSLREFLAVNDGKIL